MEALHIKWRNSTLHFISGEEEQCEEQCEENMKYFISSNGNRVHDLSPRDMIGVVKASFLKKMLIKKDFKGFKREIKRAVYRFRVLNYK